MATELATFDLVPGKHPDSLTGSDAEAWRYVVKTMGEQPGFQRARLGTALEKPEVIHLYLDWDSVDAHKKFMQSSIYGEFRDKVALVCDLSTALIRHAILTPHPPSAAFEQSPVTECVTLFFPADYSPEDQDETYKQYQKFQNILKTAPGPKAAAGGWTLENVPIPDSNDEGRAYKLFIGWDSVHAHMKFRETDAFKENVHLLRNAKDLIKNTMFHVHFEEPKPQPKSAA